MAARGKAMPVGSSQWVQNERSQANEFIEQDVEEFSYSVRNELEWLNEHMADIFSKTEVNFADMFKTPGKLRGKTPRTARKVNALAPRQPLTDIFAPNVPSAAPSPAKSTAFFEKVSQFQLPINDENRSPQHKPAGRGTSPQRVGKPYPYTDSGYHGMMTEDEMELDAQRTDSIASSSQVGDHTSKVPVRDDQAPIQRLHDGNVDDHVISDDSFVSAQERESGVANGADELMSDAPGDTQPYTREEEAELAAETLQQDDVVAVYEDEPMVDEVQEIRQSDTATERSEAPIAHEVDMEAEAEAEAVDVQSDTSSPEKPLNRKSSFTFSSLPAREPLTAKRSMGQTELHRNSVFNKSIGARQTEGQNTEDAQDRAAIEAKAHNKTTAQLLHDRINMLGKTKEPRPSKSIHQMASLSQSAYPQLPTAEEEDDQREQPGDFKFLDKSLEKPTDIVEDDEDDWIAPTKPVNTLQHKQSEGGLQPSPAKLASPRPAMHSKSISTTDIASPTRAEMTDLRHQKAISVSHPNLAEILESTTPTASPSRKTNDGPLSASKSRLWSALKSAKSIFASSASASAAAKLEAHNTPVLSRSPTRDTVEQSHKEFNMPGALWSQKDVLQSAARNNSVISFSPSRKTRHSNESEKRREKELKAQEKAAVELEKAREKERIKAAKYQAEETAKAEKAAKAEAARVEKERQQAAKAAANAPRPQSADSEKASENEMAPPPPPKTSMLPAGKLRAPGRLMRPTKEPAQVRPAPMAVRMPSQAPRAGQAPSSFSKSQHENLASSTSSHAGPRAGSAQGHRPGTAGGNARVKALEAAARKKEADEKAAAKKAEQKRELERKRAEKAEQEKRAEEERKAAEQQRALEARQAAERKAAEKRAAEVRKREQDRAEQQRREQERLDQQRKEQDRIEQQRREAERLRQEEDARKAREAHDLAEAIRRERTQQAQQHPRGDLPGTIRQLGKNTIPSANPSKPAKRQFPLEDDDHQQPQRPGILRNAPSYQQTDAKRRRTNEEQDETNQRNSVMAPPKRPSTMRKETLSKFSGYTHAPPPAAHHSSMFKSTVTAQHQMQHGNKPMHPSQLVQTSNARIPFAESARTPGHASHSQYQSNYDSNKFKTPSRPMQAPKSAKSTPQYPQGDNIELPDIATDSEDEEDDDDEPGGFRAPSWTASPALRDLLTQQQLMDPEAVFGPIGELKMEEVFKNGKNQDRLKRFRDRGSSAMWIETGDAVTSAEKRRDMELRERVVREGGWRYEPGV
ncbi:Putative inner centromere protein [Septoria linicola]|uniref:Inner centromere protein n=1 Tax=Septoria linicola TaxID=215465 RepID=A0A9Q9AXJ5_9PEZI|nr:Putative inner centromere protein [Septoria linicola]